MQAVTLITTETILLTGLLVVLGRVVLPMKESKSFIIRHPLLYPNSICWERVIIALVAFGGFYAPGYHRIGIALYILSAFLDAVDGMVARACDLITEEGKRLDPFCDKISYLIPLVYFSYVGVLPPEITIVFIVIELVGQYVVRNIVHKLGWSVAANNFGKIKAVLSLSLPVYLYFLEEFPWLIDFSQQLLIICLGLSICSATFKLIPNKFYADILSTLNLFSGLAGIYFLNQGKFIEATLAVIIGQIFDLFDGRMASKHGGTKFGPWLDDIADFISFGICPMIFILLTVQENLFGKIIAGVYLMAIGYRLLRFVLVDKQKPEYNPTIFFGLPSPAGAIIVFGICLLRLPATLVCFLVLATVLLSVSKIPFVHFGRGVIKKTPRPVVVVMGAGVFILSAYFVKVNSTTGIGFILLLGMAIYFFLSEASRRNYFSLRLREISR